MSPEPRNQDTRGRIVEATLELIADRGMSGVTMKAVAAAAGISRQTLYNHYSDVDAIVVKSMEAHQQATLDELRTMLSTIESPSGRLEHLVRHSGAVAVHHHPVDTLGQALSAEARSLLSKYHDAFRAIIVDVLQSGIETGAFRQDIDVERDSRLLVRMLDATVELAAADPEHLGDVVAAATRTVLAAVAATA